VAQKRDLFRLVHTVTVDYRGVIYHLFGQYLADESGKDPVVKIGDTFMHHLFGKSELAVEPASIHIQDITKALHDPRILEELETYETALFHLLLLIDMQRKRSAVGPPLLLKSGYPNVFYIRDMAGIVWTVLLSWSERGGGWSLDARSVGSVYGYIPGSRFISLNTQITYVTPAL
jgi:hypothetical protein